MLTKKAFYREAVLRTYWNIRRGRQVVDKELDQVDNWLKLSGVVRRQDGVLRVRNPIYERVFDEGWARDHLRLHVNWRRRLTTTAAVLLVLIVVLAIPLAYYAWRQKEEAEFQALEAAVQRDDAVRRGRIAEESLDKRTRDLEQTQKLAEKLKPSNPTVAEEIGSLVAEAKQEVQQDRATLAAPDRKGAGAAGRNVPGRAGARPERPAKPADPPAPAPPPRSEDQQAIQRVLDAYEAAYTAGDIKALQSVQVLSTATQKTIASEFAKARYQVQIEKEDINVSNGRTAVVTASVTRRLIGSGTGRLVTNVETFRLEKRRGRWMIVSPPPSLF